MMRLIGKAVLMLGVFTYWQVEAFPSWVAVILALVLLAWTFYCDDVRKNRTPGYVAYANTVIITFIVFGSLYTFMMRSLSRNVDFWLVSAICYAGITVLALPMWAMGEATMSALSWTKTVQGMRQRGEGPADFAPWPVNLDSDQMRTYGRQTGRTRNPPDTSTWLYSCPVCNAKVQHAIDVCWNCNYGADGVAHTPPQPTPYVPMAPRIED